MTTLADPTAVLGAPSTAEGDRTILASFTATETTHAHQWRTRVNGGGASASTLLSVGVTEFSAAGFAGGDSVVLQVRAYQDDSNYSQWVSSAAIVMAPERPAALAATPTSISTIEITPSGGDVGQTGVYVLLWRRLTTDPDVEGSYVLVAPAIPPEYAYPYVDASLPEGTGYTYKATCLKDGKESGYSPTASATTDSVAVTTAFLSAPIVELRTVTVTLSGAPGDGAAITGGEIDWGDGDTTALEGAGPWEEEHAYAPGEYLITGTVEDDLGGSDTDTRTARTFRRLRYRLRDGGDPERFSVSPPVERPDVPPYT